MDLQILLSIIFGSSVVTFGLGWLKDNYLNKKEEERKRLQVQEEAYREIMRCVDFIYADSQSDEGARLQKKARFIENYRLLFLHAPDKVVRGINNFLDVMMLERPKDTKEMKRKKVKIAKSMLTLREQLVPKTGLTHKDFRHIV